mgnify:CR=1 FL=1|jgi:hypothetical protein
MKKKTGEKSPTKLRQISVGVYLDAETSKRFTLSVRKEQDKQIENGEVPTISKSNVCENLIKKWLDKNGY